MEYLSIETMFNALLYILLIALVIYLITINKKLNSLRSGGDGFKAVVIELNHAIDNAQNAIQSLKLTVRDAEHGLDGNLKQARSVVEELKYLIDQAGMYSDTVNNLNLSKMPPMGVNDTQKQKPRVAQNKVKNFADTTLERVSNKRQSLPNPILPAGNNRNQRARIADDVVPQNLGQNLELGHKEIALQRREEAMRAIAEKNNIAMKNNIAQKQERTNLHRQSQFPRQDHRDYNGQNMAQRKDTRVEHEPINRRGKVIKNNLKPSNMSLNQMDGRYARQSKETFERQDAEFTQSPTKRHKNQNIQTADEKRRNLMKRLTETR